MPDPRPSPSPARCASSVTIRELGPHDASEVQALYESLDDHENTMLRQIYLCSENSLRHVRRYIGSVAATKSFE